MAQDVNSVMVIGNLVRDCGANERDFGYTQSGTCIAKISIANNRLKKQADGTWSEEANYFDVTIFGKTAENLKPYLKKGSKVCVVGTLKQERWQDGQTGENRSRIVINADEVQLLGGKREDNGQQYAQNQSAYAQQYQNQQSRAPRFEPAHNNGTHNDNYQQNGFVQEDIPYNDDTIPF